MTYYIIIYIILFKRCLLLFYLLPFYIRVQIHYGGFGISKKINRPS